MSSLVYKNAIDGFHLLICPLGNAVSQVRDHYSYKSSESMYGRQHQVAQEEFAK